VAVTVRRPDGIRDDTWGALPGETRWGDHSCQQVGGDLVVYRHTFRRVRERLDATHDVLLWKPATSRVAHRYAAGEWLAVVGADRVWPPPGVEQVPRRPRRRIRPAAEDAV
jgi:hypothetical protein